MRAQTPSSLASPYAAEIARRLESVGVEREAMDWLIKCLHPSSVVDSPGMPDESYANVVRPEYRDQLIIGSPVGLTAPTWDLLVWRQPGDMCPLVWFSGNAGTNFTTTGGGAPLSSGTLTLQPLSWQTDYEYPTVVAPTTLVPYAIAQASQLTYSWRTQYASLTAYLTASSLNDQGTIFAGQFPSPVQLTGPDSNPTIVNPATNNLALYNRYATSVPFDENSMMLLDPKAYTAPARDGCYQPLRLTGPTQPYVTGSVSLGATFADRQSGAFLVVSDYNNRINLPTLPGLLYNYCGGSGATNYSTVIAFGANNAVNQLNTAYDNTHHGVMLFRGLSPAASVTLKLYTGHEIVPRFDSSSRQFTKPPVRSSPAALAAYYAICHEMGTSFPASYNSLGTLLSTVAGVVSRLWPVVSKVVPFVRPLVSSVIGAIRGPSDKPAPPDMAERQQVVVVRRPIQTPSRVSVRSSISQRPKSKLKSRGKR